MFLLHIDVSLPLFLPPFPSKNMKNNKVLNKTKQNTGKNFLLPLVKMAAEADMAHHIKITTKLQKNHHSEPSEIELNGSLTTMELQKPHPSTLVGGAQTRYSLVPHLCVVDKNFGGIYLGSKESQPHTRPPSPGFQCQVDKSLQLLAAKTCGV